MKTAVLIGLSRHRINVDGAGITTLVAFHGCPLNCKYCLNPQALSPEGVWKRFSPEELFRAVAKDDLYFRATGGGVTFGGGEPLISCKEILIFRNICMNHISASFFEIAKVNSKCDLISPDTIFLPKGKGNKKAWGTL